MFQQDFPGQKAEVGDKFTIRANIPGGSFHFKAVATKVDSEGHITNLRITAEPEEKIESSLKNRFQIGQQSDVTELDELASITAYWNERG